MERVVSEQCNMQDGCAALLVGLALGIDRLDGFLGFVDGEDIALQGSVE